MRLSIVRWYYHIKDTNWAILLILLCQSLHPLGIHTKSYLPDLPIERRRQNSNVCKLSSMVHQLKVLSRLMPVLLLKGLFLCKDLSG